MIFVPTIGQMKMVLKFENVAKSSDNTGGNNEDYVEWFTTRGYFRKKRTYRAFETGYDESVKTFEAFIHWRNEFEVNVTKDTQVIYEARVFSIDTFEMVNEKRKYFRIDLIEVR